ncbi:MAG TPA: cation:proton antiporter [Thermotogota bacterium]|nr:cation:proton antiporter [Thermotogota bacterium]HRW34791.1 cation:proton antiporter [Thermotogota bacterium]
MALSLALIILFGLLLSRFFDRLKLPGLLGMLLLGVILGPYVLNIMDVELLKISGDLRKIALIVILLRAGLGIERETLKMVGIPAIKLSFIPGLFEGFTILALGIVFFKMTWYEAGMLGFIIAAVSPAVVVPQMLDLIESGRGRKKGIPTLILTGASIDDVIAITLFSSFLGFYGGTQVSMVYSVLSVPLSIGLGLLFGVGIGFLLLFLFKKYHIRDTKKALMILSLAILMTSAEDYLKDIIPIASLLGVMAIGFFLREKYWKVAERLSLKFNKIWVFAEIMLFVLVGAQVNITVAIESGLIGLLIIAIGLLARSMGVLLSLSKTKLNRRERLFCVIAYVPKATVQAAIGGIPLAAGVASGDIILAMAVLSIIITAPLGAIGIKAAGKHWLADDGRMVSENK